MIRILILLLIDTLSIFLALFVALNVRFDWNVPSSQVESIINQIHWLLLTYLGSMFLMRQYSMLWRYAGGRELLIQSAVLALTGALTLVWNWAFVWQVSRAVLAGACLYAIGLITASRLFARSLRSRLKHWDVVAEKPENRADVPVLLVGAGDAASFILTINRRRGSQYGRILALVDDAPEKLNMRVQNVPVMGTIADIPALVTQLGIREIIVAIPSVKGERLQQIIEICSATRCQVRIMSDPQDVKAVTGSKAVVLREPNLADFLSREEVRIDDVKVGEFLRGKTVLVTGGGGSIGSEICRQVMRYSPRELLILDIYENCAYELLMDFQQKYGQDCRVRVLIGSVRDRARLDEVISKHRPQVVFHAAAHKHVPLMEESPAEALKNNVFGTLNVMESAEAHGVESFVMLSTDKAVNPTNVMGATKRVAELQMQLFSKTSRMKCMAVRFGNVLGSNGSVIPLFERQIRAGGPVTLTHPDVTRYFMTIPEAASLVLQTGSIGESGRIYVLDVGELVRIQELADKLIRFYGFEPNVDMEVKVVGLRPGEKMFEELLLDEEMHRMSRTSNNKIMVAPPLEKDESLLRDQFARLKRAAYGDHGCIDELLAEILPNYKHEKNGHYYADETPMAAVGTV